MKLPWGRSPDIGTAGPPFVPRKGILRTTPLALGAAATLAVTLAGVTERVLASHPFPWHRGSSGFTGPAELRRQVEEAAAAMTRAALLLDDAKRSAGIRRERGMTEVEGGFIGAELTPLVTTLGSLEAKRLASRPRWASVLTARFAAAGIGPGDLVAAGMSGSFPGLNVAVIAACQALGARVIAISSVTASTWGATEPSFTWPEMEERLVAARVVPQASVAITVGGAADRGADLTPEARETARAIAQGVAARLGVQVMEPGDLDQAIRARLELYRLHSRGERIALYVNVGGGEASIGDSLAVLRLRSGMIPGEPFDLSSRRGVMARFAESGVPVLLLLNVRDLAQRWGIPLTGV